MKHCGFPLKDGDARFSQPMPLLQIHFGKEFAGGGTAEAECRDYILNPVAGEKGNSG